VDLCRRAAPRSFLDELAEGQAAPAERTLLTEIAAARPQDREDLLVDRLLAEVAAVLGLEAADVEPDQGFFELGMDSVMSLRLQTRVERATGVELPATLTFEYPNTRALARHLLPQDEAERPEPDDDLDDLSDDELLRRLDAALDQEETNR
jgi:acyl carrier protein